jgi:hypothetical protein
MSNLNLPTYLKLKASVFHVKDPLIKGRIQIYFIVENGVCIRLLYPLT